ncbi:MAG: 3-isopropylmalate dehydratase small subunit [Spirochaetes bacterium]|nr:3-isopropylmalate dehydratase small subunit [Spirochaetota bacterium]
MKNFDGKVLFLNRSDINTDEIIPAKYLTESTKEDLKPYLLEDLKLDTFNPKRDLHNINAIVTRENFGCGSSREHAPWALEVNGIDLVIAVDFARIFRQNMYNCGMMAVELPGSTIDMLFKKFSGRETFLKTDFENHKFTFTSGTISETVDFKINDFDKELVKAGGWVDFADLRY